MKQIEIITWLLSYQAPYHPEERGIKLRPKAEGWYLFSKDDMGLDMKSHVIIYHLSIVNFRNFFNRNF